MEKFKSTICLDLPVQIGCFVYGYAKLRMLRFYHKVLGHFVDRSHFELVQMDTDSLYMALSKDLLGAIVCPEKRAEFESVKSKWFPRKVAPEDVPFDPKVHGIEHPGFDKRRPGLFKIEWTVDAMVALCSKTYLGYSLAAEREERKNLAQQT